MTLGSPEVRRRVDSCQRLIRDVHARLARIATSANQPMVELKDLFDSQGPGGFRQETRP